MLQQQLIIDTDAGVDDALALLMALAQPGIKVNGITCVCGNVGVDQVTRNVCLTLDALGKDIPVYRGASSPLFGSPIHVEGLMGNDGFGNASGQMPPSKRQLEGEVAAMALVRLIRTAADAGEDFTLVMLGPLTNLALALRLDEGIVGRVPRLVIMGGAMAGRGNTTPAAEFNFFADPEAAAIVLEAGFQNTWVIPWEAALNHLLLWDEWQKLTQLGSRGANLFKNISTLMAGVLRDALKIPGMPMPDPLAMAVALNPNLVTRDESLYLGVETVGKIGRGMLAVDWQHLLERPANAHLVSEFDQQAFLDLLKKSLTG